jgi:hypothetical protein
MKEMKIHSLLAASVALLLTACASSGPVPMGRDTYMISKQSSTGFHSGASVKADIYREANDFCIRTGLEFQPVTDSAKDGVPGYAFANAEVVFRCLVRGDAEINRPTPKPIPNVIIENRTR